MNNFKTFLTFDTSSKTWSVSLFVQGIEVENISRDSDFSLSKNFVSEIDELLRRNNIRKIDLDCLGIICGPGSFTGLRVGISVVKSLSRSIGIPWFGFNLFQIIGSSLTESNNNICFVLSNDFNVSFQRFGAINSNANEVETVTKKEFVEMIVFNSDYIATTKESFSKIQSSFEDLSVYQFTSSQITNLIGLRLLTLDGVELSFYNQKIILY